jgi:Acyltransferase
MDCYTGNIPILKFGVKYSHTYARTLIFERESASPDSFPSTDWVTLGFPASRTDQQRIADFSGSPWDRPDSAWPQGSAMMPSATCFPRRKVVLVSLFLALHHYSHAASAFLSHPSSVSGSKFFHVTKTRSTTSHSVAINPMSPSREPADSIAIASQSFFLSPDEVSPIIRIGNGEKEKVINSHGLWCAAVSLMTGPVWMAAMMMVELMYKLDKENQDTHRALFDSTGKVWSKIWLTLTDSYPTFSGDIDKLRAGRHGPCLYVANHASWLDIPVLCTVLDPVFKFIAKGELRSVPCIGQQLAGVSTSVSV